MTSERETREQARQRWLAVTYNGVCWHRQSDTVGYCEACFWGMLADYAADVEREQTAEIARLTARVAELELNWAAASEFVRDVSEAVGQPQPPHQGIVDLPKLAMTAMGVIEELTGAVLRAETTARAYAAIEAALRTERTAALQVALKFIHPDSHHLVSRAIEAAEQEGKP